MDQVLTLYPEEITFTDVRVNQVYIQTVEITNNLQNAVSFRIRLVLLAFDSDIRTTFQIWLNMF